MSAKKKKQHYVWQYYLRAWTTNERLWCQREGKRFQTGTGNVAHRHDFYRLKEMSEDDIKLVEHVISQIENPALQQAARNWLPLFRTLHDVRREIKARGIRHPEMERQLDEAMNNLEENLHAHIENDSVALLQLLRQADGRVLNDYEPFGKLALFIATQYFRTPRRARRVMDSTAGLGTAINVEAAWGLLRTIYSTTFGFGIFARREMARMSFLEAPDEEQFVTGDQPVINVRAFGLDDGTLAKELELYYPLDPRRAVLINFDRSAPTVEHRRLTVEEVRQYNRMIMAESEEQVYARSARDLGGSGPTS